MTVVESKRTIQAAALAIGAFLVALGLTGLALKTASGATLIEGDNYNVEFIDRSISTFVLLTLAPIWMAAMRSVVWAFVGVVGVTAAVTWGVSVEVRLLAEGGWSIGLEIAGYLWPVAVFAMGCGAIVCGVALRRGLERQDRRPRQ